MPPSVIGNIYSNGKNNIIKDLTVRNLWMRTKHQLLKQDQMLVWLQPPYINNNKQKVSGAKNFVHYLEIMLFPFVGINK